MALGATVRAASAWTAAARAACLTLLFACASSPSPAPSPDPLVAQADLRLQQGIAAAKAGELDLALTHLEAALALAPPDAKHVLTQAQAWLAHVRMLRREPEEALAAFERGVTLDPADPWLTYGRGTALQELGRYDEAIAAYSRALALDPFHLKALQWRGEAQAIQGRHGEALADFTRALELLSEADDSALARWGGDYGEMRRWTLRARARAFDALGEHAAAERDRGASEAPAPGD